MRSIALVIILFWLSVANLPAFAETPEKSPDDFVQRRHAVLDLNNEAMSIFQSDGDKHRAFELIDKAIAQVDIYPRGSTEPIQLLLNGMIIANAARDEVALNRYRVKAIQLATNFDLLWLDAETSVKAYQLEKNGNYLEAAKVWQELLEPAKKFVERLKVIQPSERQLHDIEANIAKIYVHVGDNLYRASGPNDADLAKRSAASLLEAKKLFEAASSQDEDSYFEVLTAYGLVLHRRLGDTENAKNALERALALAQSHFTSDDVRIGGALSNLSQLYDTLGDKSRAVEHCDKALAALKGSKEPMGRSFYFNTSVDCAMTYYKAADKVRFDQLRIDAVAAIKDGLSSCNPEVLEQARAWSRTLSALGEYEASKSLLQNAIARSKLCRRGEIAPETTARIWLTAGDAPNQTPPERGSRDWRDRMQEVDDQLDLANLAFEQGQRADGRSAVKEAETILASLLKPNDPEWLKLLSTSLAHSLFFERSETTAQMAHAQAVLNANGIRVHRVMGYMNFAFANWKWIDGDFDGSVALLKDGIRHYSERFGWETIFLGSHYQMLAANLMWLSDTAADQNARHEYLRDAVEAVSKLRELWRTDHPMDHPDFAWLAEQEGELAWRQGRHEEAIAEFEKSLSIAEAHFPMAHHICIHEMRRLMNYLTLERRYDAALEIGMRYHNAVAQLYGKSPELAGHLSDLGRLEALKGNSARGYSFAALSLDIVYEISRQDTGLAGTPALDPKKVHDEVEIFLATVLAAQKEGLLKDTSTQPAFDQEFKETIVVEPASFGDSRDRGFQASQLAVSTSAARSIGQMAARFSTGSDDLAGRIRRGQEAVNRRDDARRRLRALVEQREHDIQAIAATQQEMSLASAAIEKIQTELQTRFKNYSEFSNPGSLGTVETMRILKTLDDRCRASETDNKFCEHALVSMFVSKSGTAIWVQTASAFEASLTDINEAELAQLVTKLRCGLDQSLWFSVELGPSDTEAEKRQKLSQQSRRQECLDLLGSASEPKWNENGGLIRPPRFDLSIAYQLYSSLLGRVDEVVRDKHLIFVLTNTLATLPPGVLVVSPPADTAREGQYKSAAWLGTRQPVTVLPSVQSLKFLSQQVRPSTATKSFLGIGNPLLDGRSNDEFEKRGAALARSKQSCTAGFSQRIALNAFHLWINIGAFFRGSHADIEEIRKLPPLPETADELCDVGRLLGAPDGDILLGSRATETKLKELSESGRLADYKIVHFATHAALAGQVHGSAEPGLVLTPPLSTQANPTNQDRDDGFLTASEIAGMSLNADWVVLSACNTAGADRSDNHTLSGLARAFFYAGARSLLVSHWPVFTIAAVHLNQLAYQALTKKKGMARSEALRIAMKEMVERGKPDEAHPALWAPFVVVGQGWASAH